METEIRTYVQILRKCLFTFSPQSDDVVLVRQEHQVDGVEVLHVLQVVRVDVLDHLGHNISIVLLDLLNLRTFKVSTYCFIIKCTTMEVWRG